MLHSHRLSKLLVAGVLASCAGTGFTTESPRAAPTGTDLATLTECLASSKRRAELRQIELEDARAVTDTGPNATQVPASLKQAATRLAKHAKLGKDVVLELRPMKAGVLNAWPASSGVIPLSPRVWGTQMALTPDEMTAAAALGIAFLEQAGGLREACENLALAGDPKLSLRRARQIVSQRVLAGDGKLAQMLLERSQRSVAAAHKRAVELLKASGFNSAAFGAYQAKVTAAEDASFTRSRASQQ